MPGLTFSINRARLSARAGKRIADVAREIRELEPSQVAIVGHTDSRGSNAYNLRLSRRRAVSVRRALEGVLGGGAPRLRPNGKGESQPVAANAKADGSDNPRGRARNRRVEIRIPKR